MEAVKTRPISKIPKASSNLATKNPGNATNPKATPAQTQTSAPAAIEVKFNEDERKAISELKKLYLDTIKLDVDLQRDIYNMEKAYEPKHDEIFDKRKKLLEDFKKKKVHGDAIPGGSISSFWLKVLKASYPECISKRDEKVLTHLIDIRARLYNDPVVKFIIEFHFEPNEYFNNRVLYKTYYLNCLPEVDDPLSYDGAEIYKCEGCDIDWKVQDKEKDKSYPSFFDFFSPPILPENTEDPNYCNVNAILQNDFELGFYLKERVIPKAVMFFTGEIADCQTSDSDSEDSSYEDEDDEEDDTSENETGAN